LNGLPKASSVFAINNQKGWGSGSMILRWMAQGFVEAEKRFRRIRGYREIPLLIQALRRENR
jgi:hypothetical protein